MNKKTLGFIIAAVCIVLITVIVFMTKPVTNEPNIQQSNLTTYTADQVRTHAVAGDCWMIINNTVYDVTEYVKTHPGGNEIARGCGKDATTLFESRRDGDDRVGSGTPHSMNAESILQRYKIGSISN